MKTPRPGIMEVALSAGIWDVAGSFALPLALGARPPWKTDRKAMWPRLSEHLVAGVAVSYALASASGAGPRDLPWDCVNG